MSKYIYFISAKDELKDLFRLECKLVFNVEYNGQSTICTDIDYPIDRSCFISNKMTVLEESNTFDELVKKVSNLNLFSDDYKVIWIKNKLEKMDYQTSLRYCREIGLLIEGEFNMNDPRVYYGISLVNNKFVFGVCETRSNRVMKHFNKPYSYSYSLDTILARTLINILMTYSPKDIVDPCCGVGTVILEALDNDLDITGFDINGEIVKQAISNCEHYGYNSKIECIDIREVNQKFDWLILDIPYGVVEEVKLSYQHELLLSAMNISDNLIVVSISDYDDFFVKNGYKVKEKAFSKKQNFIRFVTVISRFERL